MPLWRSSVNSVSSVVKVLGFVAAQWRPAVQGFRGPTASNVISDAALPVRSFHAKNRPA